MVQNLFQYSEGIARGSIYEFSYFSKAMELFKEVLDLFREVWLRIAMLETYLVVPFGEQWPFLYRVAQFSIDSDLLVVDGTLLALTNGVRVVVNKNHDRREIFTLEAFVKDSIFVAGFYSVEKILSYLNYKS